MYRNTYNQRNRSYDKLAKCNFAIIAILTITSTALTAYLLNALINSAHKKESNTPSIAADITPEESTPDISRTLWSRERPTASPDNNDSFYANHSLVLPKEWQPIVEASEEVETKIRPEFYLNEGMRKFKQRLATMSKKDLLKLLKIVQDRIDRSSLVVRKRNVDKLLAVEATKLQPISESNVVTRSEKMKQLMGYMDKIESSAPKVDVSKLEKLSSLDGEKSAVRIVKPALMEAILKPEVHNTENSNNHAGAIHESTSWHEHIVSVAPVEQSWPQQAEVVVEDWPTVAPSPKPKKKKKRKKIPVTTTTSTHAPIIETTTFIPPPSPAPPTAFEEVWIEEEEDIYPPPPKRKLKKYKKKTSPPPATSTTTTTTTTTTTQAPTTTTTTLKPVVEDWPDDPWPESTTKNPWPAQTEEEKWPLEEAWLNAVKDNLQNRFNIVYI